MPILARLYNGKVLEFPDDTPMEVVNRVAQEQVDLFRAREQPAPTATPVFASQAPSTERTYGEALSDIGASAIGGTGAVLAFPGQVASLVPGLREAGQALAYPGEAIQRFGDRLKSEGLKAREALRSQALSEAEKDGVLSEFATAITSTLKDPALISSFIAEQAPLLLPPAAMAKLVRILGRGTIMAASRGLMGEAAESAAKAAAERVNRRAYAAALGTGATMQGADISSDTYQRAYQAALLQGKPPEQAADEATNAARIAFGPSAVTTLVTQRLPGARAIEARMAGLPGVTGRVRSGFGEATQEALEEGAGALFGNLGVRTVDPNVSLTQGVGAAAGLGALGGGFFGAMLGKKDQPALAPGQRAGETLEQSINRLVAERAALMSEGTQVAGFPTTALEMIAMINQNPNQGYSTIVKYIDQLKQLPDSNQKTQALQTAEEIRQRLSVEDIERQGRTQQLIITGENLRELGFSTQDPVFKQLNNKDLAKPDDAVTVLETLKTELRRTDLTPTRYDTLVSMREAVDGLLTQIRGSAFYAGETEQPGVGDRLRVVEPTDRESAETTPDTDRDGVAVSGERLSEPPVAEDESDTALEFQTAKGSVYTVDDEGRTSRTKRSPGPGQGTTYEPSDVLYVTPEYADAILDERRIPFKTSVRLGYRDGNQFRAVTTRAEIPAGAQPAVAVIDSSTNVVLKAFPAQMNPVVGMSPVEKLYKSDGTNITHIGNPIVKIGRKPKPEATKTAKRPTGKKSLRPEELEARYRELEARARRPAAPTQPAAAQPEPAEETERKRRIGEIDQQLTTLLKRLLNKYGLNEVGVELIKNTRINGEYANRLIRLADDTTDPVIHLRHESIHALKELKFFTPQQWNTLEQKAKAEWVNTYLKNVAHDGNQSRYDAYMEMFQKEGKTAAEAEQAIIEEAIADAFSFFQRTKAPAGLMQSILNRLNNFFSAIKEFLRIGNLSADQIFGKIEAGELRPAKDRVPAQPMGAAKQSLVSGVPKSTRMIMEANTKFAQVELGLKTEKVKGATGTNNVRDIARALNNQTLNNFGGMTANDVSAGDANDLARALADEIGYQLRATATTGTGLGWYSYNYPNAVDKLAARFPELKTNKTARAVFTACVAVSSNGENVTTNINNAILMYEDVREGKPIRDIGVRRADAFINNKRRISELLEQFGDNFAAELMKVTTVKAMNAQLRAQGQKTDGSYLANTEVPVAAIYFGPKLGAFYANLMGAEGYLTMDMWWTRTINRMRGLLMPQATEASINKFRTMIGQPDATRDEVIAATIPFRNKYDEQGYVTELEFLAGEKQPSKKAEVPAWTRKAKRMAGAAYPQLEFEHRLEKMANTIYKNEYEMLEEAPFTGSDRAFMYKIARDAQRILKQEGINLSVADIQAAIWYYEKRLYAKLSERVADDIGYDEAIAKSAASGRRAGPSLVFPDKPNAGYVPPGSNTDVDRVREEPGEGRGGPSPEAPGEAKLSLRSDKPAATEAMDLVRKAQAYKPQEGEPAVVFPLLFHSGTGDPASLATYIEPQFGSWVTEVLSDATDEEVDTETFVPLSYYASKPEWVRMQTARKLNKPVADVTQDDVRQYGQLAIVYNVDDEFGDAVNKVYQIGPEGYNGGYTNVVDVYGKSKKLYETDLEEEGDYRGSGKTLFGVEPGDIVSKETIEPNMVLVGDALIDFLDQYKTEVEPNLRFSLRAQTQTPAFKQWFGDSKAVDADGNPLVVYHGTTADFTEFDPTLARSGSNHPTAQWGIFFAANPEVADIFAGKGWEVDRKSFNEAFSWKPPKPTLLNKIRELFGLPVEKPQRPTVKRIPYYKPGGNIMPMFVSVQNPKELSAKEFVETFVKKDLAGVEAKRFIDEAKADGHDGIVIRGEPSLDLEFATDAWVAFQPEQIKSAIGNVGTFSPTERDIRKSLRSELTAAERDLRVRWADSRIEKLLSANAYLSDGREKDTKGFAAAIRPNDFLNATAREEDRQRIAVETGPLDPDRLAQEDQELFLEIAPTNEEGVYQIKNHEGRHRMTALMNAGYNGRIPVVLLLNRKNAETEEEVYLRPQQFRVDKELITAPRGIFIPQMIPINWEQRKELREVFGGEADLKFSLRSQTQTPAFKRWFGDSKVVDENGEPLVMYHGTTKDFSVFQTKGGAVFVTPSKSFANKIAMNDMLFTDSDVPIAPFGANVMSVYVRAERPFDFENPSDIKTVQKLLDNPVDKKRFATNAQSGKWQVIEDFLGVIEDAGFDGAYISEQGIKNLAVFAPTQVKSAIGNIGTFSLTDPDIRKSLRAKTSTPTGIPNNIWMQHIKTRKIASPEFETMTSHQKSAATKSWKTLSKLVKNFTGNEQAAQELMARMNFISAIRDAIEDEDNRALEIYKVVSPEEYAEEVGEINNLGIQKTSTSTGIPLQKKSTPIGIPNNIWMQHVKVKTIELSAYGTMTPQQKSAITKSWKTLYELAKDFTGSDQAALDLMAKMNIISSIRDAIENEDASALEIYKVMSPEEYAQEVGAINDPDIRKSLRSPQASPTKIATWFSGARTLEAALRDVESVMAVEYDEKINDFANTAFGTTFVARDVKNVNIQEIKEKNPVLFHASPVCKNFSAAKTFAGADENDRQSAESVAQVIREVAPPIVTIENVPKYASTALMRNIVKALDDQNYTWDVVIHDAADYGAAQTRQRMLLRAVKNGPLPPLPEKVGPSDWYKQIEDLLDDAPDAQIPPVERQRLDQMIARKQLDPSKPIITMGGSGFKGTWAASNAGSPAPTLKSANEKPRIILPDNTVKNVTPRMMARLMGLPDSYPVPESPTLAKVVLGNGIHGNVTRALIAPLLSSQTTEPDIRKSLRSPQQSLRNTLPPTVWNRVDMTIGQRVEKGWVKRITDAISPRNWSSFRDQFINHYEGLAVADRIVAQQRGGIRLLADESAESAALFSDLGAGISAAAFGVHDRIGGYPVFQNGVVKIENQGGAVKGPLAIFSPLAAYGDPDVYRLYQFWVTAQRGERLDAGGRKTPFTATDMAEVRRIDSHPELGPLFKQVHQEWIKYNDGLVKFMEQTGVITPEASREFRMHGDYFPMYKYMEMDDVAGPRVFASIANVPVPKKLKGDDINPMGDFFENIVRNTQSAIQMGIKNIAAQRATKVGMQAGLVRQLGTHRPTRMDPNYYRVLENGKEVFYAADDILFMNAIKSLQIPEMPWIGLVSGPANLLRNMVTKTPDFMGANMLRDSVSAWVSSGVKITPIVSTLRNFGAAIAEKSPELNALRSAGILGGYDYASKVDVTAKQFAKDLRKISSTRTTAEKMASPFTSIWEALEKGSSASDAATRMEVYKKVLAETNNEAEALFKALEIMNFNRKGRNPLIRILTAAVPFLNARIQGLDVLYRAGIRPLYAKDATQEERAIAKTFVRRGLTIMALSMAYWALTHDDDEYKRQEQETRDNYWLIPSMGIKIPIPFEIGVIFKVVPERLAELAFGDDTSKDFAKAMARHISGTFAVQLPQVMQPALEAAVNYNMFTQRAIVGQGLEQVQAPFQVGPTTSRTAQEVANFYNSVISLLPVEVQKTFQASPMILEHLVQGYTGTMGTYAMQAIDAIINANSDVPSASKRFEQMPVIKRFALDPMARGTVTSYYELKNSVDEVVRTTNLLERTGQFDKMLPYVRDNMGLTAIKGYVSDMEKTMKEIRDMKNLIRISSLSAEAKRDQLNNVERLELALTANIQQVKKRL